MIASPLPFNVMIAEAGRSAWAHGLARGLSRLPVSLHWPHNGNAALGLAATRRMHVAVLDEDLPDVGGWGVVRNIRSLGLELPCMLVCRTPDQHRLREAIQLDVFSVLEAESQQEMLAPMVIKLVRRVYHVDWTIPAGNN